MDANYENSSSVMFSKCFFKVKKNENLPYQQYKKQVHR